MLHHVYKHFELTGSSPDNIEFAVGSVAAGSTQNLHDGRWFEVVDTRDHIEDGCITRSPATITVVFTIAN